MSLPIHFQFLELEQPAKTIL